MSLPKLLLNNAEKYYKIITKRFRYISSTIRPPIFYEKSPENITFFFVQHNNILKISNSIRRSYIAHTHSTSTIK